MKVYLTATDALIDYLHWLHDRGQFNSAELAKKLIDAGVPQGDLISESTFRLMRLGQYTRLVESRAVAACRVFGIQVNVINPLIPDGWKKPKR